MTNSISCTQVNFDYIADTSNSVVTTIFKGVNFSVSSGKIVSIMGRSGCGKTTLLNLLNGLLKPTSGKIVIDAKRPATIFQDKRLIPWQTVANNIRFGANELGITLSNDELVDVLLNVGLSPKIMKSYPNRLSGGMQQRVSLARSLVCKPDMLYMDEPFSALDALTKNDLMYRIIDYIKLSNATAILVTHDIAESCFLADEIYEMRGYPAKLQKIADIEIAHSKRNGKNLEQLKEITMNTIREKNKAPFTKVAYCPSGKHIQEFIDYMNNRAWKIIKVENEQSTKFDNTPDCIIIAGNHPDREDLQSTYKNSVTRFLWLDSTPTQYVTTLQGKFDELKEWWGWENLYNDLITNAPKDKIQEVIIGHNWSYVRTAKGSGVGRTPCRGTEGPRSIDSAGNLIGKTIKEIVQGLISNDDLARSLAIAGLSAVYNPTAVGRTGEMEWGFGLFKDSVGEKVCIGNFSSAKVLIPDIKIIEREPKEGHYPVEAADTLLQKANYVVITAQTLMNGSLPRILFLSQGADIMILGPSAPLSQIWQKYGVRFVCGVRITDDTVMRHFISQAGTMLIKDEMTEKISIEF